MGGIVFHKEVKRWDSIQRDLEFDIFNPRLKSGTVSSNASLGWTVFFGWWSGFSEGGSIYLYDVTNVSFNSLANLFFCLHIHSLWHDGAVEYALVYTPISRRGNRASLLYRAMGDSSFPHNPFWIQFVLLSNRKKKLQVGVRVAGPHPRGASARKIFISWRILRGVMNQSATRRAPRYPSITIYDTYTLLRARVILHHRSPLCSLILVYVY